jgi:hypothetical protein
MAPGIRVKLNGDELVTVSTGNLHMIRVSVSGDRLGPELAAFDVAGMAIDGDGKENTHWWWNERQSLNAGDELKIEFLADAVTSRPGVTFEDTYPDYEEKHGPMPSREHQLRDLAAQPLTHDVLRFALRDPEGTLEKASTLPTEHGFGFGVTWVWLHPEYAKVSLHCYDLDYLQEKNPGRDLARFKIVPGQTVTFRVG